MRISAKTLKDNYGIDLPRGKYYFEESKDGLIIYSIKDDTEGCILVGKNSKKGMVLESKKYEKLLVQTLQEAANRGEKITITIKD